MPPSVGGVSGGMHARNLRIGSIPPGCIKHRRCHTANSVKKLPIPIFRPAIIGQRSLRHPLPAANVAGIGFTPDLLSPVMLGMEWLFALLELLVSRLCSQAGIITLCETSTSQCRKLFRVLLSSPRGHRW